MNGWLVDQTLMLVGLGVMLGSTGLLLASLLLVDSVRYIHIFQIRWLIRNPSSRFEKGSLIYIPLRLAFDVTKCIEVIEFPT